MAHTVAPSIHTLLVELTSEECRPPLLSRERRISERSERNERQLCVCVYRLLSDTGERA